MWQWEERSANPATRSMFFDAQAPSVVDTFSRILAVLFGLIPSLFFSWIALFILVETADSFVARHWFVGSYTILANLGMLVGTFFLAVHIFGTPRSNVRAGLWVGSISLLFAFILRPLVFEFFERYLAYPSPISNPGIAGAVSMVALFPFCVFVYLATTARK